MLSSQLQLEMLPRKNFRQL